MKKNEVEIAIVILVNNRYFHAYKNKRIVTAWSLAGANLFRPTDTVVIEKVEKILKAKGYKPERREVKIQNESKHNKESNKSEEKNKIKTPCMVVKSIETENLGSCYSTGKEKFDVDIKGFKTSVRNLLKDGNKASFLYAIEEGNGLFYILDVRAVKCFPTYNRELLKDKGLSILSHHINDNPLVYYHILFPEKETASF